MRYFLKSVILLTGLALTLSPARGAGNVNFTLGERSLDDEDDWAPTEDHDAIGVTLFLQPEGWAASLALGYYASDDSASVFDPVFGTVGMEVELTEFSVGFAKVWDDFQHARPFLGGGLTLLQVDAEINAFGLSPSVDDDTVAPYLNGGIFWRLGKAFNLGIDARIVVGADVELEGVEVDADYTQFGALIGWGW